MEDLFKNISYKGENKDNINKDVNDKEEYIYNGKTIDEIIEFFHVIVDKYGAKYDDSSWAGSGEIMFYAKDKEEFMGMYDDIFDMCVDYHLNVSCYCSINLTDNTGKHVIKMRFLVPGKLLEGFVAG